MFIFIKLESKIVSNWTKIFTVIASEGKQSQPWRLLDFTSFHLQWHCVTNSVSLLNLQKGKSAGYRVIYLLESETSILLLTIYNKSEQEDITDHEINSILDEFYRDE